MIKSFFFEISDYVVGLGSNKLEHVGAVVAKSCCVYELGEKGAKHKMKRIGKAEQRKNIYHSEMTRAKLLE